MPMLNIDGVGSVEVGPEFTRLTPDQQNATVDEIIASIKGGPPPAAPAPAPMAPRPAGEVLEAPPPAAPPPEPGLAAAAGRVASRAGEAAVERFGDRPLGLSEQTIQELRASGALAAEGRAPTPIQLLNEVVYRFGAKAGDALLRSIGAGFGALGGAAEQGAVELGEDPGMAKRLGRDVPLLAEVAATVAGAPAAQSQAAAARGVAQTQRAAAGEAAAARAASPAAAATTTEEFKTAARSFYKQAEDAGVIIKPTSMKTLATEAFADAAKAGLDEVLTKNALAAVNRLEKLADPKVGPVSFETLDRARQVASDAATKAVIEAKGKTTNDLRIAEKVIDKIDDFIENLSAKDVNMGDPRMAAQAIVQARDLWSRAAKLDTIERLVRRAEESASQFRGSGFENALVTQFRQLSKNEAAMKRFAPDEQDAIRLVNRGTTGAKLARATGSLAARGPVSAMSGATFGGSIGTALLGPGLGSIAGAGAQFGIGEIGRKIATALARRAVSNLEEVIRAGGKTPFASSSLRRGTALITRLGATAPAAAGQAQRPNGD